MGSCYLLSAVELAAMLADGYTVNSGPHASEATCLGVCSGSGVCACDPMPCAWEVTITGLTDGDYTPCADVTGTFLLDDFFGADETFDGSCAWYSAPIPYSAGHSLYWAFLDTPGRPEGDWGLQLQLYEDATDIQEVVWVGYVNTTDSGDDCTSPITVGFESGNSYSFQSTDCNDYPLSIELTPVFDCSGCADCGAFFCIDITGIVDGIWSFYTDATGDDLPYDPIQTVEGGAVEGGGCAWVTPLGFAWAGDEVGYVAFEARLTYTDEDGWQFSIATVACNVDPELSCDDLYFLATYALPEFDCSTENTMIRISEATDEFGIGTYPDTITITPGACP